MTPEELKNSHKLHEFASELRGKLLNGAAWIDMLLCEIITSYFCTNQNRRALFFSEIGVDINLYRKTELRLKILKREFPVILVSYPRLQEQLNAFRKFRNLLAHSHIDTSKLALGAKSTDEVTFIFYENGKTKRQRVTRADAQSRAKQANQLRDTLLQIQSRIVSPT
jgi:hypothetical protein